MNEYKLPKACKISIYENAIYIDNAHSDKKGGFFRFFIEELIPYCKMNSINHIYLTDGQLYGKDIWGNKYGFSGRYRCGDRHLYVPFIGDKDVNDIIEVLITYNNFEDVPLAKVKELIRYYCNDNILVVERARHFLSFEEIQKRLNKGRLLNVIYGHNNSEGCV